MGTAVVLAGLLIVVGFAIRSIVKDKKEGKGCGSCPGGCSCHNMGGNHDCKINTPQE